MDLYTTRNTSCTPLIPATLHFVAAYVALGHEDQVPDSTQQCVRRTIEGNKARAQYADEIYRKLEADEVVGTQGMFVVDEHACGCCLYHGDWLCAHCCPDSQWSSEVKALIATILDR